MKTTSRTLVKSAPEVWEQLDQPERMQGLMSALVGHATEVEVYERVEQSKLAWKAGDEARIEIKLAEKGWGTNVSVSVENGQEPTKLEGWLDAVLDEIATPQKRPFEGMAGTPSGTVVDAMVAKPDTTEEPALKEAVAELAPEPAAEQVEEPQVEEPPVEKPQVEKPPPEEPQVEEHRPATPEPERPFTKLRRFLGLG